MADVIGWLDEYAWGAFVILRVFLVAALLTVVLGLIGSAARLAGGLPSRLAGIYITFFRGTPELLVLLLFYFGAAVTLTAIARAIDPSAGLSDIHRSGPAPSRSPLSPARTRARASEALFSASSEARSTPRNRSG